MTSETELELLQSFGTTLDVVGASHSMSPSPAGSQWDRAGAIEGVPVVLEVRAVPTAGDVLALDRRPAGEAYKVVVARRISASVAEMLADRDIGFYDARGRVRLWRRPLLIDTSVASTGEQPARRLRFDVPSLLDVALAVLDGTVACGVRAAASAIGRAPGTVSKQLAALRLESLVAGAGEPTIPDLFEAVVDAWLPERVPLAGAPTDGAPSTDRLRIGADDLEQPGWVLADLTAAAAWGAPVVLTGDSPPDFYVPDRASLAAARVYFGTAEHGRHACTVAAAPAPYVCLRRAKRPPWLVPAPSPLVAALDLASDPARGRDTLERWSRDLPPELRRVW